MQPAFLQTGVIVGSNIFIKSSNIKDSTEK